MSKALILWRHITDDFGNMVSITEIHYPNPAFVSLVVQRYWK